MLARIRERQGKPPQPSLTEREAVRAYLSSHPHSPAPRDAGDAIERFRERALSLASTLDQAASLLEVPARVASYLLEHALSMRAVCWPQFLELDWGASAIEVEARSAKGDDLVGITGASCAIAETGTLVTLSGHATPASVSLLTETHIAVLPVSRIVRTMEDAWGLIRCEQDALPRAVNFISGPSRTADIEQTVTLGAHGPYRVHIILVAA